MRGLAFRQQAIEHVAEGESRPPRMIILTNPGSNVPPDLVARYGVELTPQKIMVDGVEHDTRGEIDFAEIDAWVRTAKEHPYVLGTSAAQFTSVFVALAKRDPQIFAVMTSRKVIQTHDSAVAAKRSLEKQLGRGQLDVHVADSGFTDLGAGFAVALAGEAARAGRTMEEAAALVDAYRQQARFTLVPDTLEYLVKGGRATALRSFMANVLRVKPLIGMVDGELAKLGKVVGSSDRGEAIASDMERELGQGRRVWVGVFHGNAPSRASTLARALSRRFRVEYQCIRPLAASIYLHMGPGAVGAVVAPIDRLPFEVPAPPSHA